MTFTKYYFFLRHSKKKLHWWQFYCDCSCTYFLTNKMLFWVKTAEKMMKRYPPEAVFLVKLILMLLSTKLGTLLVCGSICFDTKWPFIHSFHDLNLNKREKILQKWSNTYTSYIPLRLVFLVLKLMVFYIFFSLVSH